MNKHYTHSEHLLFVLEIITAQFLVLPQQPSSLLPVSVCVCVCVCGGGGGGLFSVAGVNYKFIVHLSFSDQTLRFLRSAMEKIKYQRLLVRFVGEILKLARFFQPPPPPIPSPTQIHPLRCTPLLLGNVLSCLLACDVCSQQSEPQGIRQQGKNSPFTSVHTRVVTVCSNTMLTVMGVLRALLLACCGNQNILPQ